MAAERFELTMASLNKIMLIGRLTRDPELKYTPQGTAVCKFGIAVSRKFKGGDGQMQEQTTFINIVVWGKQGENCSKFISKGREVFVEGHLDIRDYETQDGQKRKYTEVVADMVQFLGSKPADAGNRGNAHADAASGAPRSSAANAAAAEANGVFQDIDGPAGSASGNDDVPF